MIRRDRGKAGKYPTTERFAVHPHRNGFPP